MLIRYTPSWSVSFIVGVLCLYPHDHPHLMLAVLVCIIAHSGSGVYHILARVYPIIVMFILARVYTGFVWYPSEGVSPQARLNQALVSTSGS